MKKLLIISTVCIGLITSVFSQTNTINSATFTQVAQTTIQTNLNQAMIEILSGVKVASGEIYTASKEAITKSITFVEKETPDVLHQFILLHIMENLVFYVVWLIVPIVFWVAANKISKYRVSNKEHWYDDDILGNYMVQWILIVVGFFVLMVNTCNYGLDALKIYIAPKVYILEHIVNMINNHR